MYLKVAFSVYDLFDNDRTDCGPNFKKIINLYY